MDADRFDRWTRLLSIRMSRRTAATGLGAAVVASLAAPRWALGQDDDEDQETDVDQHKDNPTGEDSDDDGGDEGGDNTSDDQNGNADSDELGFEVCRDITRCKTYHCTDNTGMDGSGECHFDDVGEIPAGPFPQMWVNGNCPNCCTPVGWSWADLEGICNRRYKDRCAMGLGGGCAACADFSLFNCH